jgi:hypothetical protein
MLRLQRLAPMDPPRKKSAAQNSLTNTQIFAEFGDFMLVK